MKTNRLDRSFFVRPTVDVARGLLGKFLVKDGCVGQINEVEAYVGEIDPACHAYNGITKRTEVMFGPGGFSYVYFIYGMYFCFNVVTEDKGFGSAVLIRGIKPISGVDQMFERRNIAKLENIANGPSKLCQALDIHKSHNGIDLCRSNNFWIEDRGFKPLDIMASKRIGIQRGKELEWRFTIDI